MSKAGLAVMMLVGCRSRFGIPADGLDGVSGDSAGPQPPSCIGLAPICGAMGNQPCCESPLVPGGTFYRSYDTAADMAFTDMSRPATVSTYRLDKYEVTVARFRKFVEAGQGTQASPPPANAGAHANLGQSGWDPSWNANLPADTASLVSAVGCAGYSPTPDGNDSRAMGCLGGFGAGWYVAMAFCAWDGGFLPTEAEWNYAASGGSQQRAYPWSQPADATTIDCSNGNYAGPNPPNSACVSNGINNVGAAFNGDSFFGQSDMAGNVTEWVLDYYAGYSSPCVDCANLIPATARVIRGGAFIDTATTLRSAARGPFTPGTFISSVGVRCARAP